jgi:H+/Cl- antiporter ClcA
LPSVSSILLRWPLLLIGTCIVVGAAGAGFLHALGWVGRTFEANLWLVWSLPCLGLLMTWIYARLTPDSAGGVRTLIGQIRAPGAPLPLAMGPAIVGTTLLSHLGGASVGREGTALLMGGALADRLGAPWRLSDEERRTLLVCGVSAGFGAVFGTPFAAAVFALEFIRLTAGWWYRLPLCLLAGLGADWFGRQVCGAGHTDFRLILPPDLTLSGFLWAVALGVTFGLVARAYLAFVTFNPAWKTTGQGPLSTPYRAIFVFGLLYAGLVWFGQLAPFTGLGLELAQDAGRYPLSPLVAAVKFILTALCIGAGFRGGEVTPLFVIGACVGSSLADLTTLPVAVTAALGFVGVFAGAGAVPLAGTLMACELFDPHLAPYAAVACGLSWLVAGRRGLYAE